MLVPIAIFCWVFLFVVVLVYDTVSTQRRERFLKQTARELGFEFEKTGKPFAGSDVQGLTILKDDPVTSVADVLSGQYGGCSMLVFDVACCDEFAVNAAMTTCAAFRSTAGRLPPFQVTSKSVLERMCGVSAKERSLCAGDELAKHLSVHCSDDGEVRKLLTPERLARLRRYADHFRIESSADWILVYRPGVRVSASNVSNFVNAASAVASVLLPDHSFFIPAA